MLFRSCLRVKEKYPEFFKDKTNFKFFKDFGNPSRCAQIATMFAEGEYLMWGSDDGYFTKNSIKECLDLHSSLSYKDVIALRYTEGKNYSAIPMNPNYWMANYHAPTQVVPLDYRLILVGMFKTNYFREIGGWDCRFEALNMNCHDLAFRVQNDGGKIHLSPNYVSIHDWNPEHEEHLPIQLAHEQNDLNLFNQIHEIVFHGQGGYDWETIYNMPRWLRQFTFNKINFNYEVNLINTYIT